MGPMDDNVDGMIDGRQWVESEGTVVSAKTLRVCDTTYVLRK